jgi:hypothetical protein
MTVTTLFDYLFGDREAIRVIAGCRQSIWVGLLFVFSAALAREYDGADLWHEPRHLVVPLGASLLTSFLLLLLVYIVARNRGCKVESFFQMYRSFLGLYWMTAPLAWLYAIPVERMFEPENATAANLLLLALVSLWRVGLMTRVISVLFHTRTWAAFFVVMFFADSVALVILRLTPLPLVQIMGGVRLSPSEQTIRDAASFVGIAGLLSWPVWLIGLVAVAWRRSSGWELEFEKRRYTAVGSSLWRLAACSVAVWMFVLPVTQPEQQRKWRVERDLRAGRLHEAIAELSAHERADYPPHWDPPPRIGYGGTRPRAKDVVKALVASDCKPWVRELYLEKFVNETRVTIYYNGRGPFREDVSDDDLDEYLTLLEQLHERSQIVKEHRDAFEEEFRNENRRESIRERMRRLYEEAG